MENPSSLTERLRETGGVMPVEFRFPPEQIAPYLFAPPPFVLPAADFSAPDTIIETIHALSKRYGIFEIVNHGISSEMMNAAMNAAQRFYQLPSDMLRAERQRCWLYSSSMAHRDDPRVSQPKYWRDTLSMTYPPLHPSSTSSIPLPKWPEHPFEFRNAVLPFTSALEQLADRLIYFISRGLGLDQTYFRENGLCAMKRVNVNQYPRCPEPNSACGLPVHCDSALLTITFARGGAARALEACIDGSWKRIVPRENALIVTLGGQMQVVSNEEYQAPLHRVIVSSELERTSICYAVYPGRDSLVGPAVRSTRTEPDRYITYPFDDYWRKHIRGSNDTLSVLNSFKIRK